MGIQENAPRHLFRVLFAIIFLILIAKVSADPDLWGHLRFGADIIGDHQIARVDTYSFTSDRPWINHEWLAEVVMATMYDWLGRPGLFLLATTAAAFSVWILSQTLSTARLGEPVHVGLLLSALIGSGSQFASIRPQIFSVPIFAALLWLLARAERGRPAAFLWLPALFACWANLHGGWTVGLGVVLLWTVTVLARRSLPWRWAASAPVMAALGTLVNPFGLRLWAFVWETVGIGRPDVLDWQPLWSAPSGLPVWLMTLGVVALAWRRRSRGTSVVFLPVGVLAVLSLKVLRIEPYFAMTAAATLAPLFEGFGPATFPVSREPTRARLLALGLLLAGGVAAASIAAAQNVDCLRLDVESRATPEADAVEFMKLNHLRGNLLTWFDYGEYAIWHLSPAMKVSYDGRRETVYSAAVQRDHLIFYWNARDAGYAERVKADYVWLPNGAPVTRALERAGWIPIFRGTKSSVYSRSAGPFIQPASFVGRRCFPGP